MPESPPDILIADPTNVVLFENMVNLRCLSERIADISCQPCSVAMALRHLTIQSLQGSGDSHALGLITMCLKATMPCSSGLGASESEQLRAFCRGIAAFFYSNFRVSSLCSFAVEVFQDWLFCSRHVVESSLAAVSLLL